MSENSNQSSGGIGFVGLLTIVFITLKLTGYIDWSWWWVWSPIWVTVGVILAIFVVIIIAAVLDVFAKNRRIRRR
jgi:hypothetical protein